MESIQGEVKHKESMTQCPQLNTYIKMQFFFIKIYLSRTKTTCYIIAPTVV